MGCGRSMKILKNFVDEERYAGTCQGEVLETSHNTPVLRAIGIAKRSAIS
jgi:hypothetical protein